MFFYTWDMNMYYYLSISIYTLNVLNVHIGVHNMPN